MGFEIENEMSPDPFLVKNYNAVINDICDIFNNIVGPPPLNYRKINVYYRPGGPFSHFLNDINDNYRIGISIDITTLRYAQLAYQFSHELCHIYCFHKNYRINVDNWLIESICEMASFYILEKLYYKWSKNPPLPNCSDYAIHLKEYKDEIIREFFGRIGIQSTDLLIKVREDYPIPDQYDRDKNQKVALFLLPYFNDNQFWKILKYIPLSISVLNNQTEGTFENSTVDFDKLINILPNELKNFGKALKGIFMNSVTVSLV